VLSVSFITTLILANQGIKGSRNQGVKESRGQPAQGIKGSASLKYWLSVDEQFLPEQELHPLE